MLKTECPDCKSWVYSPLLVELEETDCPDCGQSFAVNDVFISSGPYTIYRDVLLKNMNKYMRLLKEAKDELAELKSQGEVSRPHEESATTLHSFVSGLEDLLAGCRERHRVSSGNAIVKYSANMVPKEATLVNISTTGACLDTGVDMDILNKDDFIILSIADNNLHETLYFHGEVVWWRQGRIGIRFTNLDKEKRELLQNYILYIGSEEGNN